MKKIKKKKYMVPADLTANQNGLLRQLELDILKPKYIPRWLQTYHLTYMTILWSIFVVLSCILAIKVNRAWLILAAISVILQLITDHYDGLIGRKRNTGLIIWGFFMDHFLDYVFACSITFGLYLLITLRNDTNAWIGFFNFAIYASFINLVTLRQTFLDKFKIHFFRVGPSELRWLLVIFYLRLVIFGFDYLEEGMLYSSIIFAIFLLWSLFFQMPYSMKNQHKNGIINYFWSFLSFNAISVISIVFSRNSESFFSSTILFVNMMIFSILFMNVFLYVVTKRKSQEILDLQIYKDSFFLFFHKGTSHRLVLLLILFITSLPFFMVNPKMSYIPITLSLLYTLNTTLLLQKKFWDIDMNNKKYVQSITKKK